ncbi:MAG: hypothetical protein EPN79_15660 [Burkholderiaceae bacterium]|nr:MAG: hypothetical protein EPN79_15660 [Burkholderiaceae bacterium]
MNASLAPGSRLLCDWDTLLTPDTAPACFRRGEQLHHPQSRFGVAVATRADQSTIVRAPIGATDHAKQFLARVALDKAEPQSYLVLDLVDPRALQQLLAAAAASDQSDVVVTRLLHEALAHLEREDALQAPAVAALMAAAEERRIVGRRTVADAVSDAVRRWRVREKGKLPPAPDSPGFEDWLRIMLDGLARQYQHADSVVAAAESMGRSMGIEPLRAQTNAAGRVEVWMTVPDVEQDDRIGPWVWVDRWVLKTVGSGHWRVDTGRQSSRDLLPMTPSGAVSLIHEWPEAMRWKGLTAPGGLSPTQREDLIELVDRSADAWKGDDLLWGDPDEAFGAVVYRNKPGPGVATRLVGAVYRPDIGDIVGILLTHTAPVLYAYRTGSKELQRAIERWAPTHLVDLSSPEPVPEITAMSGSKLMRLFASAPVLHAPGKPRQVSDDGRHTAVATSLALGDPAAYRYVPECFASWIDRVINTAPTSAPAHFGPRWFERGRNVDR